MSLSRAISYSRRSFSAAAAKASSAAGPVPEGMLGSLRNMGSLGVWMRDRPNHVKEDMAFFQQEKFKQNSIHTYLKRDSDKFSFGGMAALGLVTTILFAQGLTDMIFGRNKKVVG